ncbi:EF-P 5-aminopentanol modification-associated protein YfmH [Mycoplasma sp. P36-A1]|uniref:EF-P 5-aminopentanol modification-associated protein YfmH n=1 Tax=Mycoplasma sp. P36-A1 TaxID=3252900 RepID=UPI003C30E61D
MNKKYYKLIDETLYSFKCDNGLEVYLLNKPDYYKTYGIFATKFGSVNSKFISNGKEYSVIDGAAHFLEHKMFEKNDYDVMDKFSSQQASSNAFTSFDKTAYLFTATNNVNENIETLLDFVQDLQLTDKSVEKEKPIISSEINMYEDDADWQLFFQSLQSMYHNNPVKIDIAGTTETISKITKEDLELYYNNFYHPSNMVLFICGRFDLANIEQLIKDNQNKKQFEKIELSNIIVKEPKEVNKKEVIKEMDVSNTKYMFSFKVNEYVLTPLKQDLAMGILLDALFAKSNNFFQDLLKNQKVTNHYQYSYTQDDVNEYAYMQFGFATDDDKYLTNYLSTFFKQDLTKLIKIDDFNRIKARYTGDFIRMFNNPEGIANTFISYKFDNYDLFNVLNEINDITIEDLYKLCKLFNLEYSTITKIIKK